jgi:hypothetical protein
MFFGNQRFIFVNFPLLPLTEVNPQPSAIRGWQPTRRLAVSCGLGRCRIRTRDCRTTAWCATIELPRLPIELPRLPIELPCLPIELPRLPIELPRLPAINFLAVNMSRRMMNKLAGAVPVYFNSSKLDSYSLKWARFVDAKIHIEILVYSETENLVLMSLLFN